MLWFDHSGLTIRRAQTAIDLTGRGGRVIVASWYGPKPMPLRLGTDFHRSQITIKASQVLRILYLTHIYR